MDLSTINWIPNSIAILALAVSIWFLVTIVQAGQVNRAQTILGRAQQGLSKTSMPKAGSVPSARIESMPPVKKLNPIGFHEVVYELDQDGAIRYIETRPLAFIVRNQCTQTLCPQGK